MKKATKLIVLCVALVALLASCTSFQVSGLTVNAAEPKGTVLGTFETEVKITKFLGAAGGATLANIMSDATDPAIVNAIKAEIVKLGGTTAIDVKIVYGATVVDMLLNSLTGNLYAPATATVSGKVIK